MRHADESFWEEKPDVVEEAKAPAPAPQENIAPEPAPEPAPPTPAIEIAPAPIAPETSWEPPAPAIEIVPELVAPPPPPPEHRPSPVIAEAAPKESWWTRLRQGLARSSSSIAQGVADIFTKKKLSADMLEDLEDVLVRSDLGVAAATRIAALVGKGRYDKQIAPEEVRSILADEVERVLAPVARPLEIDASKKPFVILVVGVNGSGKTTTIGKLCAKFSAEGKTLMLAAGDTFRAAAIEQLRIWGGRMNVPVIARETGADAADSPSTPSRPRGSRMLTSC